MAFTNSNAFITGQKPVPTPVGAGFVEAFFTIALATGDLALNTIGQVGILPPGMVPVEVRVIADDLDSSTAALVLQVGIWDGSGANLSTSANDGGGAWGDTGSAVNTAFDKALTRTLANMRSCKAIATERKIGMKVTTAPTTAVAGNVTLAVTMKAAPIGAAG